MGDNVENRRFLADLEEAFLATTYRAETDLGTVDIRIGESSNSLETLLSERGHSAWAFLSAANPGSIKTADDENLRRHRQLVRQVEQAGRPVLPGMGIPDHPGWDPEPSVLVLGISMEEAVAIGREHGQLAIVAGQAGDVAQLVPVLGGRPDEMGEGGGIC